jgi:hypothetical protein
MLTKNRANKIVVKSSKFVEAGTILKGVSPDFSKHVANGARYDFLVESAGRPWQETVGQYVIDEDHSHDGQRRVGSKAVMYRYLYGRIVGREGSCQW